MWNIARNVMVAALSLALVAGSSGCATIFRGRQARVQIESLPSGATVWVDDQLRGKTPVEVTMTRDELHTVRFRLDDHEELTVQTDREISGAFLTLDILEILFFGVGVITLTVDGATGAWYDPGPAPLRVLLSPTGQRCASGNCAYLRAPEPG